MALVFPAFSGGRLRAFAVVLGTVLVLAALTARANIAAAHSYKLGDIEVGHIWAPPPKSPSDGIAVYGPILNMGKSAVRLAGASSPIAKTVRFRIDKNGQATWPSSVELQPGKPVALAPWRVHIWLTGLKSPVREGADFPLTLDFGAAGKLNVKVIIEKTAGH